MPFTIGHSASAELSFEYLRVTTKGVFKLWFAGVLLCTQLTFYRLAAVTAVDSAGMLSVDGSTGSASTNQTATFGCTPSDTTEEALAVPAKRSSIHGNPEGLGTPTPKDHGSLASSRRPRSPVMSGAIREVSSSSRHSASSPRRKTSVIRRTKSSPETGQHESVRVGPRLIRRKGVSANAEAADDSDMRDDFDPRSAGLASPPAIASRDLGSGLNLE